jgi:tripartite-type tricarboxylate transporter receptor subunit TctC
VVENMPGAATLVAVRNLDSGAPADGTVIAMFDPGLITASLIDPQQIKIKLTDYRWVGNLSRENFICYSSLASGVKTLGGLFAKKKFVMGTTSKGSDAYVNEAILRNVLHAPIVQVAGYPGSSEQRMAIESGELDGACADWVSMPPDWIAGRKVNVFVRFSPTRPSGMPATVSYALDFAKTPEQRALIKLLGAPGQVSRPFIVSRRVPQPNLEALRAAFEATEHDPNFQADLRKQKLSFYPVSGAEAERIVSEVYRNATPDMISQIKQVLD